VVLLLTYFIFILWISDFIEVMILKKICSKKSQYIYILFFLFIKIITVPIRKKKKKKKKILKKKKKKKKRKTLKLIN